MGVRGKPLPHGVTDGLDFRGFDDYAPGMDVRHLDWPLYARTNRLYVRRYAEEAAGLLVVLVDASGSMGVQGGQKWRRARDIAAVLVFTALRELHQVALGVVHDGRPLWLPPTAGLDFVTEAFDFLGAIEPKGKTDLAQAVAALPNRRLTGHALILSDLLDPEGIEGALAQITQRGLTADLGCIRIPDELIPPENTGNLADPEGDAVYRFDPAEGGMHALRARISAHDAAAESAARRHRCQLHDLGIEAPLGRVVEQLVGLRHAGASPT